MLFLKSVCSVEVYARTHHKEVPQVGGACCWACCVRQAKSSVFASSTLLRGGMGWSRRWCAGGPSGGASGGQVRMHVRAARGAALHTRTHLPALLPLLLAHAAAVPSHHLMP